MNRRGVFLLGVAVFFGVIMICARAELLKESVNFDSCPVGQLPGEWQAGTTNPTGPDATWEVVADPQAPSGKQVLSLTKPTNPKGKVYNVCWTDRIGFKNGKLEVRMRANTGQEDQGGGIMWRVKDKNNYYVCRYNPLETNYRLYSVKDGNRQMIAEAKDIKIPAGVWMTLGVKQDGNAIVCSLDGTDRIQAVDTTFPDPGGIGFWTKADAATSFDSLIVERDSASERTEK